MSVSFYRSVPVLLHSFGAVFLLRDQANHVRHSQRAAFFRSLLRRPVCAAYRVAPEMFSTAECNESVTGYYRCRAHSTRGVKNLGKTKITK